MNRFSLWLVVLVALVAALPALAQEQPRITEIVIAGNEQVPADQIMPAIASKVGEPYDPERAEKDRQAVLALGWFYPVEVSTEPAAEGVRLIFRVQEKMVVRQIEFEGNTVFSDEQLRAVMETKPGAVLNDLVLNRDLAAIEKKYADAGYTLMTIRGMPVPDLATGTLTLGILEGVIGKIEVVGNHKTKTYVITRELRTKPGDVYNRFRIERDLQRLFNTDLFADISARQVAGELGKVTLEIRVEEKKTGIASVGVAYSSVQKLVGFADVAEANVAGSGQRVSVRAEFGGRNSYELGYFNPWLTPSHTSLSLNLYNKVILREVFSDRSILYDEKRTGGNLTLSRPLSDNTRIYGSLRADNVSARSTKDEPLPPDVLLRQGATVRSLGSTIINDTRDLIAEPSRGGYNSASLEFAGWLGGAHFNKFGGDLRRYWKVGTGKDKRPQVFAMRLMGGFITGAPPALEQFLVGGGETLRGFRNDRFPGLNMLIVNSEYRHPLGSKLAGVLFVDVGDAWGGSFAEDFGDPSFSLHVGYGLGVRVGTPIGQIRLDFGLSSEGNETHFSVGQAF
jgi:outer membrane protein insertion porin family